MTTKTRYLADDLRLPADWQAERYSTTIELIGPNGLKARIVLPQEGSIDIEALRAEAAQAIKEVTPAYVPLPIGTVRGPYHAQYPGQKPQTQFLVQGPGGWVPFIRIGANCEAEARQAAESHAAKLKTEATP